MVSLITGIVALVSAAVIAYAWLGMGTSAPRDSLRIPNASERRRAYEDRSEQFVHQPDDPATALFLLDEAKRHYAAAVRANKSVEGKAQQMLALVAGGSSAIALFAVPHDGQLIAVSLPIAAALALTLAALVSLLYVLRTKTRFEPTVAEFISRPMARDPRNRFVLALALAEDFEQQTRVLLWSRRYDATAMFSAYVCVIAAALLISTSVVLERPARGNGPSSSPASSVRSLRG